MKELILKNIVLFLKEELDKYDFKDNVSLEYIFEDLSYGNIKFSIISNDSVITYYTLHIKAYYNIIKVDYLYDLTLKYYYFWFLYKKNSEKRLSHELYLYLLKFNKKLIEHNNKMEVEKLLNNLPDGKKEQLIREIKIKRIL